MKPTDSDRKIISALPIVLLILVNVIVGVLTFRSYGISWDEPLFYAYADDIGYAYSIQPRLQGTFDLEKAFGPSATDHAIYGPAYLLMGRNMVFLLEKITQLDRRVLWHLVNFLTFQVGVVFLYLLGRRWVSTWGAFAGALLFSTQPLLWGHAFINPKDIPFLVFFLVAIYAGLKFVDRIVVQKYQGEKNTSNPPREQGKHRKALIVFVIAGSVILLILLALNPIVEKILRSILAYFYNANPASMVGKIFHTLAEDAGKTGIQYYGDKLISIYHLLRYALIAILTAALAIGVFVLFWPSASRRAWQRISSTLDMNFTWSSSSSTWKALGIAIVPGILFGVVTSIRVLGFLAVALVMLYYLLKPGRKGVVEVVLCMAIMVITIYVTWPYLWYSPVQNFINALRIMSNNPQTVVLVFNGVIYGSADLPRSYLPTLMGISLTEPVWPLFFAGLVVSLVLMIRKGMEWRDFSVIFLWLLIPFLYVIIRQPPIYDGFRHFLFILPPVFIIIGILFGKILDWVRRPVIFSALLLLVTLPGLMGIKNLHPYEYAYYNAFVGGPSGAFRKFESDYWLTCYREAMQPFTNIADQSPNVYVMRQPSLASIYAPEGVNVLPYAATDQLQHGDYILLSTRNNRDLSFTQAADIQWSVKRGSAEYCIVKEIQ